MSQCPSDQKQLTLDYAQVRRYFATLPFLLVLVVVIVASYLLNIGDCNLTFGDSRAILGVLDDVILLFTLKKFTLKISGIKFTLFCCLFCCRFCFLADLVKQREALSVSGGALSQQG